MAAGTGALLIVIGGGAAGVAALTRDDGDAPRIVTAVGQATTGTPPAGEPAQPPAEPDGLATAPRLSDQADRTGTRAPRDNARTDGGPRGADSDGANAAGAGGGGTGDPAGNRAGAGAVGGGGAVNGNGVAGGNGTAPQPGSAGRGERPAAPRPVTSTRIEVETREIPFRTRLVRDPALPRGSKRVQSAGAPGEESLRYEVTLVDGQVTDRRLMDVTVTRRPEPRVIAFGTMRHRDCGRGLDVCVPLGRSATCPDDKEESTLNLDGSVVVLDQDLGLLDPAAMDDLNQLAC